MSRFRPAALQEALALMPTGFAWTKDPKSVLARLLEGLSSGSAVADGRACDLIEESDPRTTGEMLADWETAYGLPDDCFPVPKSVQQRRDLLVSRAVGTANPSRSYFIQLAKALGYEVAIEEGTSSPFRAGANRCGERLGSEFGVFEWTVIVASGSTKRFLAGDGTCGDPLAFTSDEILECVIRRSTPAHTRVRFRYLSASSGGDFDGCWVTVYGEHGQRYRLRQDDGTLFAIDEEGDRLNLGVADGRWTVIDEIGNPLQVFLDCEDSELDDCWLTVLGEDGQRFRLRTIDGELYAVDEMGNALDMGIRDDLLFFTDQNGDEIVLSLDCEDSELCWMGFEDEFGSLLKLYPIEDDLFVTVAAGRLALDASGGSITILDQDGYPLVTTFQCDTSGHGDEFWLPLEDENGAELELRTQDLELYVGTGLGQRLNLGATNQELAVLDEAGATLTLALLGGPQ